MTTASVMLDCETIDAIAERAAQRTIELLRQSSTTRSVPRLVDPTTLAQMLGVSRDCVYAHAAELGGERIGNGPRGRLRFDLDKALSAWTSRYASERSHNDEPPAQTGVSRGSRARRTGSSSHLLPIRGSKMPPDSNHEHR